jgi:hypothetical protein
MTSSTRCDKVFAQHGYVEGRNIVIETRFAHGHLNRVPEPGLIVC